MLIHMYDNRENYAGSVYQEGAKADYASIFARYPSVTDLWPYTDAGCSSCTPVLRKSIAVKAIRKASGTLFACFKDAPTTAHPPQEFDDWKLACDVNLQNNLRTVAIANKALREGSKTNA